MKWDVLGRYLWWFFCCGYCCCKCSADALSVKVTWGKCRVCLGRDVLVALEVGVWSMVGREGGWDGCIAIGESQNLCI